MVKKLFLFLAITAGLLTSCKDYDDDIDDLQAQIDGIVTDLADIQDLVDAGKFVQTVEDITNGIKITFSDGTVKNITNGTNGAKGDKGDTGDAGTSSVTTIGTNGNWFINGVDTGVKAAGTNGTNGQDGEDGDKVTIVGGVWFINGVSTGVSAVPGSIMAVLNADNSFWTITVVDQEGETNEIVIPVASQFVTGLEFNAQYASSNGLPLIYAPIMTKGATQYASSAQLTYNVNPSSVQRANFEIMGLVKTNQIVTKANTYIPVTEIDYTAGVLKVGVASTGLGTPAAGTLNSYALVVKNLYDDDGTNSEKLITSAAVSADQPVINSVTDVAISKADFAALLNNVASPDWNVVYNDAAGVAMNITSYFQRIVNAVATKVELKNFFNISYTYTFDGGGDNAYFEIPDQNVNVIKVKNAAASAIGRTAKVKVTLKLGADVLGTATVYVKAVNRPPVTLTLVDQAVTYTKGMLNPIAITNYSENIFIDEIDNIYLNQLTVSDLVVDASNAPVLAGIWFTGTDNLVSGESITLNVDPSLAAGTYTATRTYQITDGSKWIAKYTITLNNPAIPVKTVAAFWSGTTQIVKGRLEGGVWTMKGLLTEGFDLASMAITVPTPNTLGALAIAGYTFQLNPSVASPNISLLPDGTITTSDPDTYIGTNKLVKVDLYAVFNNATTAKIYTFDVKFNSPLTIAAGNAITFGENVGTTKSPLDGFVFTVNGAAVTTDEAKLAQYIKVGVGDITSTPDILVNPITVSWTAANAANAAAGFDIGKITFDNTIDLSSALTVKYAVTFTTQWGQTIVVNNGLTVTVNPQ